MSQDFKHPTTPAELVFKLCIRITGLSDDAVGPYYQHVLRLLASSVSGNTEKDDFQIAEKIKRKLARQEREADAATFAELYRKLQSQNLLKNSWAILHLLLNLSDEGGRLASHTHSTGASLFTQGLSKEATSTPYRRTLPPTPALSLSSLHGATVSSGSSGISSIPRTSATREPSSQLTNISESGHIPNATLGSRLALGLSRTQAEGSGDKVSAEHQKKLLKRGNDSTPQEVPEILILKEIVYVFQGIEGKIIKFEPSNNGFYIDTKAAISQPVREVVLKFVECGWLYNKIRKFADSRSAERAFGLVGQSFCAALHQELTEYYRLIAILEAQIQLEEDQGVHVSPGGLTLRRLSVWMFEPLVRLKALAALVDICKGKKGGALASSIHSYLQHGDPAIRMLVKHTLTLVAHPIYSTIMRWIYDGDLEDTFHEFFVASDPTVKDERLWHDKYSLRKSMVPSFITMDQAHKILLMGKSINFLRQVCKDQATVRGREVVKAAEVDKVESIFSQDLESTFQKMVDTIYKETSSHLLDVLHTKYKFMDHLKAMRRYLLLGQGDFIKHLMDLLEEDLGKPAGTLYLHNLTGILDAAVRATNAQFDDSDILKRLDVRLLEVSPGDTGWDVFSLDYHVDGPIRTVFTPECMIMYLRVFNFLWRAKRMEYILTGIWKQQMSNMRLLKSVPELPPVLHMCHVISSEMVHFIQQVQYYINFEVLECSWADLLKTVWEAEDLDHIIAAHQVFLDSIITRCLLDDSSREILTQLRTIFDLVIQFQTIQDKLYQLATDEQRARESYADRLNKNTRQGEWGLTEEDEEREMKRKSEFQNTLFKQIRSQLKRLSQSYQNMIKEFLIMLNVHSDVNLRFLSFRLDFNELYKSKEPKLRTPFDSKAKKKAPVSNK